MSTHFSRNRELLDEIERDLADGAGAQAPDAADVLERARERRDDDTRAGGVA
ncbi:hypothetical protein [Prauserella rugosa]|uniref:hypothetical protein n=1 Tax=Prauserella rugosa TaxID=43354 RepID=UPI000A4CE8EA|nr:hypothetical protein [Prauserella rugosa]